MQQQHLQHTIASCSFIQAEVVWYSVAGLPSIVRLRRYIVLLFVSSVNCEATLGCKAYSFMQLLLPAYLVVHSLLVP